MARKEIVALDFLIIEIMTKIKLYIVAVLGCWIANL
jgi:hypothetical protein